MNASLTDHAILRSKERCGWKPAAAQRMATLALERGIRHADTKGALKRYFDHLYLTHHNANNVRIYGRHVFIFCEARLITVLNLGHQHVRAVDKLQHERAEARTTNPEPAEAGTTIRRA